MAEQEEGAFHSSVHGVVSSVVASGVVVDDEEGGETRSGL